MVTYSAYDFLIIKGYLSYEDMTFIVKGSISKEDLRSIIEGIDFVNR